MSRFSGLTLSHQIVHYYFVLYCLHRHHFHLHDNVHYDYIITVTTIINMTTTPIIWPQYSQQQQQAS